MPVATAKLRCPACGGRVRVSTTNIVRCIDDECGEFLRPDGSLIFGEELLSHHRTRRAAERACNAHAKRRAS